MPESFKTITPQAYTSPGIQAGLGAQSSNVLGKCSLQVRTYQAETGNRSQVAASTTQDRRAAGLHQDSRTEAQAGGVRHLQNQPLGTSQKQARHLLPKLKEDC